MQRKYLIFFRKNKISTIIAPRRSLKGQLRFANNMNAKLAVILGEDEIKNNSITVKFLNSRDSQIELQNEDILKNKEFTYFRGIVWMNGS